MENSNISFVVAFLAGLLSFASPCVLPLVPAYLAYVTGISITRGAGASPQNSIRTFLHALTFVAGFSVVFIALGASASLVGAAFQKYQDAIRIGGGILLLIVGIHLTGVIKISFLEMEKRFQIKNQPSGYIGSFFVGLAFAAGWTPCIGPILGGILVYAAATQTVARGTLLLAAYALGLGVPFLLSALAIGYFLGAYDRIKPWLRRFEVVSGVLLIGVGFLLLGNGVPVISGIVGKYIPFLDRFN